MTFFRNREVKVVFIWLVAVCIMATVAGFFISVATGVFSVALCLSLCGIYFIFTKKRYQKIALLCEQIDIVLHGNDALDLNGLDEGELSILQSEIYKMTIRLRDQADTLKKEKCYLADAMADISHQLRTPLTSINLMLSFLGSPDLEDKKRFELIREMETLLARIDWLLTNLLKMSKIDAGTAIFKEESVLVDPMLKKAAEPLDIPLEVRNIELLVIGDEKAWFTGDMKWTIEAVGNVIKNCMEHTDNGGKIEITFSQNTIFTQIKIKDNGSGIDADDLPHIFERFYQGKHNREGSFGIGLALCRMILSMQNATIKASNHADGGACFSIRFYHHNV